MKKTLHVCFPVTKLTFQCHMACDQREVEYWLENNWVRNDDIESRKNLASEPMELIFKWELHRFDV